MITVSDNSRNEVLVRAENVSKKFCRSLKKSLWYGMQDIAHEINPFSRQRDGDDALKLRDDEFLAVNDVSFELRRGECLGLIGRNGAGKTTLLKMLNGLLKPDHGQIEMRGRVGALIALGAGFNPILTGRENVYVNGAVLGLSRAEIDDKIGDIIAFSDLTDFIDSPVQSYSSGMQVRLGFAVATAVEPDILILDEVLAVGDAEFRAKCYSRLGQIASKSAIILVSHAMEQIAQVCSSGLLLERGKVSVLGNLSDVIAKYENNSAPFDESKRECFQKFSPSIKAAKLECPRAELRTGDPFEVHLHLDLCEAIRGAAMRVQLYDMNGRNVAEAMPLRGTNELDLNPGHQQVVSRLKQIPVRPGTYMLSVLLYDHSRIEPHFWSYKNVSIKVIGYSGCTAPCEILIDSISTQSCSSMDI
jgi:lipopolysaccharide transport system ATP-binding protein